ncbi:hypothetical protein [Mastigocladopsis repens]|nr:hypothetical protein [Mastigocladopsis repens]
MIYPERDILNLPQIQQELDKDTLLLQYSLGKVCLIFCLLLFANIFNTR